MSYVARGSDGGDFRGSDGEQVTAEHIDATSPAHLADSNRGARYVDSAPRGVRPSRHTMMRWLTHPVSVAFAASRVVAVAALLVGGLADEGRLSTSGLTAWDGEWYLIIVQSGYGVPQGTNQSSWPFFPFLPGTTRALAELGIAPRWGLIAIANVAFVIGLAGVWRLACDFGSRRVATIAVAAVAVSPFASVFSMGYPSSLFLAASTWAFVFLHQHRDVAAGLAAAVATLVRPNGIVVVVALVVALHASTRTANAARPAWSTGRRLCAVCGPSMVALGVWCFQLWRWTGNPLVFVTSKAAWDELTIVTFAHTWNRDGVVHFFVAVAAFTFVFVTFRRIPVSWIVFAGLFLLPSLGLGIVGLGRYCGECFPVIIACGLALESAPRLLLRTLLAISATAMAVVAFATLALGLVP